MDWTQFALFFLGVFGLFIWNRTESRTDIRAINASVEAIRVEVCDFHGRLCALEEKYQQMNRK